MTPPRVLILHGWQGSPPGHWQHWLADELRAEGAAVRFPTLPACDAPCPDRWGAALHPELAALAALPGDGERVVCCHSLGCVLWFREAHRRAPEPRVDRVVLVAPPCPGSAVPELARFYPTRAQREDVLGAARGETLLVCSDNDHYCPGTGAAEHWGRPLGLEPDVLPGQGHLNIEAGYGPWPAMADWVLGRRERLAAAA
jgi:predicted alpha/beta hydrolase family esterase